jgi:hypothetical protein
VSKHLQRLVSDDETSHDPSARQLSPISQMNASSSGEPREQRIQIAVYRRYEARDNGLGHDVEDWLAAEAEVGAPPTI